MEIGFYRLFTDAVRTGNMESVDRFLSIDAWSFCSAHGDGSVI